MNNLIDSVADLTALRDRDELEIIVALVMFDSIGASKIVLWRVVSRSGELQLQRRALFDGSAGTLSNILSCEDDLPALDTHKELRACFESRSCLQLGQDDGGQYGYVFPVLNERGVIGFLEIYRATPLGEDQSRLISGLLRIYWNHLRILDYSENDELTGLLNRKTFDEYFRRRVQPKVQPAHGLNICAPIPPEHFPQGDRYPWLAVIDIDYFKRINDQFGHLYGDEVLVLLSRLMVSTFRETDRLFRCGGEEFVVILEQAETSVAAQLLENFRRAVEAYRFPQVGRVTVSIGYTCIIAGDNSSDAFGRADQALYVAKQNGRDQVRSYEALISENVLHTRILVDDSLELF